MKRMIEAAKQLGSHAAKRILDWVMQTGEVSTRKEMDKNTRHCERSASSRVVKQSHETQSKIHVIANEVKQSQETKSFVKEITSVIAFPRNDVSKIAAALLLCLIISTTAFAAAYRCVPCKQNYYCLKGTRYQCPTDKPVTQMTGTTSEAGCMSCVDREGTAKPVFDDLLGTDGDCVSCYEYSNGATPVWNGSACVACASGTAYNTETGLCESTCPANTVANEAGVCILSKAINECGAGYIGISTAEELAKIGVDANYPLSGSYCLLNDISLEAYGENYNNGEGWTTIGNYAVSSSNKFTGIFDGNGHEISDLYINREADYQGLFGYIDYGVEIRNLGVVDVDVTGQDFVGGLVGGNIGDGTISNSYATGSVTGTGNYVGDLVGDNRGTISNSYATGDVTGDSYVGGLVGDNSGTIDNSYATGSVTGKNYVGGLVGRNYSGTITNSYATSSVTGTYSYVGGLVGYNYATITNSYFDTATTGMTVACGSNDTDATCSATGKTTAQMQTPSTFSGWDTTIWELVQGQYPKLKGVGGQ